MRSKETDFIINMLRRQERETKINRHKINASIIVFIIAAFWSTIVGMHPSFWFRLIYFPIAFGTTASLIGKGYVRLFVRDQTSEVNKT